MIRAVVISLLVTASPLAAAQRPSPEDAVSGAVMSTCYGLVGGDDVLAAERSVEAGRLLEGPPEGFPAESLATFLDVPEATARAYHADVAAGSVLVVVAPEVRLCSVAYSGDSGLAVAAEVDRWFNGAPSPFEMTTDRRNGPARTRTYRPVGATERDMTVITTVLDDGAMPETSVRFWATLARVGN